jgi:tetratricopeptide (TPR) repeat protein
MLFDLQGKRKRVIQVIYAFLALLLAVGLVGLGIGGDAQGGIFDALGLSDGSSGSSQFDQEIEDAEATLASDPENEAALLTLARYHFLAGQQELEEGDDGSQALTDEALSSFQDSVDAWERYVDVRKGKPDDSVAGLVFQAYANLAFVQTDPVLIRRTLEGAIATSQIVAEARPSPNSWLQVATYAYLAGNERTAERAGERAVKEANQADRKAVETQLKQVKRQGEAIQAQLEQQSEASGEQFENPLGGLGDAGSAPGTEPPAP